MYNGRDCSLVDVRGAKKNSIDRLGARVASRGVLLDLAAVAGVEALEPGHEVLPIEIEHCCEAQGVEVVAGDVVLMRTGHLGRIRRSGGWSGLCNSSEPGIGLEGLEWFARRDVAAIANDTWAFEVVPTIDPGGQFPVHAVGIVHVGLLLGELFWLDDLASDCRQDSVYEFFFVAPPLPIIGAVGSPIQPVAIK
jgi:kynurenine formamidase